MTVSVPLPFTVRRVPAVSSWRSGALWDASGLYGLVDVAVGSDYALYLMEDGSVRSSATLFQILGYDRENPFDDWGNLRQIEILDQYAAGLTRDGTVLTASPIPGEWTPDTSAWTGVVRLVPEKSRGMLFALTESGRVLAAPDAAAEAVSGWQNIKELLANESYVVGLTADGHVLTWAAEGAKPLDTGDWENVTDISLGRAHLLALLADGTVLATGDNSFGQCG